MSRCDTLEITHERRNPRSARRVKKLRKRDGDRCHWCGGLMLFDGNPNNNLYATVEHKIKREHGGTLALHNIALAHRKCNSSRHSPHWLNHLIKMAKLSSKLEPNAKKKDTVKIRREIAPILKEEDGAKCGVSKEVQAVP